MKIKAIYLVPLFLLVSTLSSFAIKTTYLYVAKNGSSANNGDKDHPFASLEDARKAIDQIKEKNNGRLPNGGITVMLREGIYELSQSLSLSAKESGTQSNPVTFCAYPGEKVTLTGGRKIAVNVVNPISQAAAQRIIQKEAVSAIKEIDLKSLGITDYGVHQITGFRRPYVNAAMELFINGKPYHLARYPNNEKVMLHTQDIVKNGLNGKDFYPGVIRFDKEKLAQWANATDIMTCGNFSRAWATDQLRVKDFDATTGEIRFADAHMFGIDGGKEWNQYFFYNLMEEIDQPGEYYIDHKQGKLYFYPLEELKQTDTILVSMLEDALVTLKGASYIRFKNISFDTGRGIGIYMENTVSNQIDNCTIRNMGVVAVCVGTGSKPAVTYHLPDPFHPICPDESLSERLGSVHELLYEKTTFNRNGGKNNGIINCKIENTGCGGISLGGGDRLTLEPAGNYVYNCEFTNCGRIDYSYKAPVNIDGVGNKVQHCQFNQCPATAIYIHGNDHIIEYNKILDACSFVDDQGSVYLGRDPSEFGNIIRYNFFKDIGHVGTTMAVYYDDGACGTQLYGNVFYKAGNISVMVGGGSYNPIFNNIFIDSKLVFSLDWRLHDWQKMSLAPGGLTEFRLKEVNSTKPPYATKYPGLATYFQDQPDIPKHNDIQNNVFVNAGQINNGRKEWGPVHPENFITKDDPGFIDAANLNFTLKADADVFKKLPEFKAIPFADMGLVKTKTDTK